VTGRYNRIWLSVRCVCYAHSAPAIKLNFCQHPDHPGYPPHVCISWALPQTLASWGILLHQSIRPSRLLQLYLREPWRVSPFHVSIFRGLRTVLYAGSLGWIPRRVYTWHLDQFPFWAYLSAVWQVSSHDAYVPSSRILSITTCLGRHHFRLVVYPLSFPLSTIDN
jgi:hypothetical protein